MQQARLWLVVLVLVALGLYGPTHIQGPFLVFLVATVGLIPFLEVCDRCGRIVWLERGQRNGPLWIGRNCRHSDQALSDEL